MKILINACNLRVGGGKSIGMGVIETLYEIDTAHQYDIIITANDSNSHFSSHHHIKIHRIPSFFTRYILGRLLGSLYLSYIVRQSRPDAIFSMGNYAIATKIKQLLLIHWPYLVYPDSIAWQHMNFIHFLQRKIREKMVRRKLHYSKAVTVQTNLMKERFQTYTPYEGKVHVIESATSFSAKQSAELHSLQALAIIERERLCNPDFLFFLFPSFYYTHKNMEIIIPLSKELKRNNSKIKLFISVDPSQNYKADKLLKSIEQEGLHEWIINLGTISPFELRSVYEQSDALFMPSLIESFGITYIEAMTVGIPILTSDLDFAHQVCGEVAFYFNPLDYRSIYKCFIQVSENPTLLKRKIILGKERAKSFLSWEDITRKYLFILETM